MPLPQQPGSVLLPAWTKPENASVLDPWYRAPLRTLVSLLGADDPTQIMGLGVPIETGAMTGGVLDVVAKKLPRFTKAIRAFHGSPHDFPAEPGAPLGKFKSAAINTGEGNQTYGHGLYFAENPAVATSYQKRLSPSITTVPEYQTHLAAQQAATDATLAQLRTPGAVAAQRVRETATAAREAEQRLMDAKRGRMYEVAINADPKQMLDWDAPVSARIRRAFPEQSGADGKKLYQALSAEYGGDAAASQKLREAGIPGIKYLDQGSRETAGGELVDVVHGPTGWQSKIRMNRPNGEQYVTTSTPHATREAAEQWARSKIASQGSRNFVVFDDATIDILKKYGVMLPIAGAAAAGAASSHPPQEIP